MNIVSWRPSSVLIRRGRPRGTRIRKDQTLNGDIDPDVKKALDERIAWIDHAFHTVRERGLDALPPLIDQIPDEHLRSMIYVLTLQRDSDYSNVAEMLGNLN
jgi:hypothetical protein